MRKNKETLNHSPEDIVIGITQSPEGKPCVGMTIGEQEWILFTTTRTLLVDRLRQQLKQEFQIESLPGLPIDWRASLVNHRIVLTPDNDNKVNKPIGVFIPAASFDSFLASSRVMRS